MKAKNKWLIASVILMILSFMASGFFFIKSGILNLEDGTINEDVLLDIEIFNDKINQIMGIPISENQTLNESIYSPERT